MKKMTRRTRNPVLLFCVVSQMFVGVALAQGFALCVGPNEHRAFDVKHPFAGCPAAEVPRQQSDGAPIESAPSSNCDDVPLFGSRARVRPSASDVTSSSGVSIVSISFPRESVTNLSTSPALRLSLYPVLSPQILVSLETVVLLV